MSAIFQIICEPSETREASDVIIVQPECPVVGRTSPDATSTNGCKVIKYSVCVSV